MTSILTAAPDPAVQRAGAEFTARRRRSQALSALRLAAAVITAALGALIWGGAGMTSLLVGVLAYSATACAVVAAMIWGAEVIEGDMAARRKKVATLALALTVVQALMWMRLGAGLGG